MIGENLTRFQKDQEWVIFDFESNGLNLKHSLPWELSWGVGSFRRGLHTVKTRLIKWPNFRISPHLALKTHFDPRRYAAEALPPQDVYAEFASDLYDPQKRRAGHNILGFDSHMISVLRVALGLKPDHSWMGGQDSGAKMLPALDTDCISKAYWKKWTPDLSSPLGLLAFQWSCQMYIEKGLKTNLGLMCSEFGIPYDSKAAHSAEYDIGRNWLLLNEIVKVVEC